MRRAEDERGACPPRQVPKREAATGERKGQGPVRRPPAAAPAPAPARGDEHHVVIGLAPPASPPARGAAAVLVVRVAHQRIVAVAVGLLRPPRLPGPAGRLLVAPEPAVLVAAAARAAVAVAGVIEAAGQEKVQPGVGAEAEEAQELAEALSLRKYTMQRCEYSRSLQS